MKNKLKYFCLTLSIIFIVGTLWGEVAYATPPNVELEGNANGIVFINGEEPFLVKYNMLPGDVVQRKMVLINRHSEPYKIYLRAKRITKKEKYDLLNKIDLEIFYNNKLLYKGPISGEDGLVNDIYLGTVKPGQEKDLEAKAVFDGNKIGNEYKNKNAEVEWIFTAVKEPRKIVDRKGEPTRELEEVVNKKSTPSVKEPEKVVSKENTPNIKEPEKIVRKENTPNINGPKKTVSKESNPTVFEKVIPKTGYEGTGVIGICIIIIGIFIFVKKDK